MCGRYELFLSPENREFLHMVQLINQKYGADSGMKIGEIFPTNKAMVLAKPEGRLTPELFLWGFPSFRGNGVIINARKETAMEKPMFRKCLMERRCVIPSTGFYEWSQEGEKKKYHFFLPREENLYMAGLWKEFQGERRYVILTTAANATVKPIHHRMPVILQKDEIRDWVNNADKAVKILESPMPFLEFAAIE